MYEQESKLHFIKKASFWRRLLFIALVITIIPLLAIAPFNHSSGDDYSYGYRVHDAVVRGGNPISILKAVGETVTATYQNWQGTYSAVVLFSIEPAVWGEQYYWISTFVLIAFLLLGIFSLFRSWIGLVYGRKDIADIAACGVSILFLQMLPSPVQGLYWWNGASYYIIWNALMMVFVSQLIVILHTRKCSVVKCIALALLGVVIGGANLITALLTLEITILLLIYGLISRNCWKQLAAILFFVAVGFLVNVTAPGNANRQQEFQQVQPMLAILKSFYAAFQWALRWTNPQLIALWLLFLPFAFALQRQTREKAVAIPLWCELGILVCLFASMFTPNIYAGAPINSGRIQNIRFLFWMISGIAAEIMIARQITTRVKEKHPAFRLETLAAWFTNKRAFLFVGIWVLLVGLSCAITIRLNGSDAFASVSAAKSLLSGQAQAYDKVADERIQQLLSEEKDIVLQPFTDLPYVLYKGDVTTDAKHWRNTAVARFYGKDSVVLGQETIPES